MAYNTNLPPTIARTGQSSYELRDSTGSVIQTYSQAQMDSPTDWWEDVIAHIIANTGKNDVESMVTDLTLLIVKQDWTFVDER